MNEQPNNLPSADLSTATTDELIAELQSRCDAMALGLLLKVPIERGCTISLRFHGPRLLGRGLVQDMVDWQRCASAEEQGLATKILKTIGGDA